MTTTETAASLLKRLAERLIAYPEQLIINPRAFRGAATWQLVPHPEDYGRLNGKQGTHIRALEFLMYRMGMVNSEAYGVQLTESEYRQTTPVIVPRGTYQPEEDLELLVDWMNALAIETSIDVIPMRDGRHGQQFIIVPRGPADLSELKGSDSNDEHARTIIGSIGTLFRAIGRVNGGVEIVIIAKEL